MNAHEASDANVRLLARFGAGILVLVLTALAAMAILFHWLAAREVPAVPPAAQAETRELPPEPRLQVTPRSDLERMRRTEESVLESYSWVDRKAGIVRIPIERAMDLVVERGAERKRR